MNKMIRTTLVLAALCAAPGVRADDNGIYAGVGIGGTGSVTLATSAGREESSDHPRIHQLYGGYEISKNFAIEAGFADFGKYKFASGRRYEVDTFYLAAKGSVLLSQSWSLFGKVGAARQKTSLSGAGTTASDVSNVRPMFAIGAEYRLTRNLGLSFGLADYGTVKTGGGKRRTAQNEIGLNYHF